jgi:hypothetical protein
MCIPIAFGRTCFVRVRNDKSASRQQSRRERRFNEFRNTIVLAHLSLGGAGFWVSDEPHTSKRQRNNLQKQPRNPMSTPNLAKTRSRRAFSRGVYTPTNQLSC